MTLLNHPPNTNFTPPPRHDSPLPLESPFLPQNTNRRRTNHPQHHHTTYSARAMKTVKNLPGATKPLPTTPITATQDKAYPLKLPKHPGPIFRLLAKVTLPHSPPPLLRDGVAPKDVYTIIANTIAIHCNTTAIPYATIQPRSVTFLRTQPSKKRNDPPKTYNNLYNVEIIPAADNIEPFDSQLFRDQATTMVLEKWTLRHPNDTSAYAPHFQPADTTPPSPNPWAPYTELLLPSCNSFDDTARGLILGSLSPAFHGSNRRVTDALTETLFDQLRADITASPLPHAKTISTLDDFRDHVGIRVADFRNNAGNTTKTHRAYFLCTSSDIIFTTLRKIASKPIRIYNSWAYLASFPANQTQRDKITAILTKYLRFYLDASKAMRIDRFPLRPLTSPTDHDDFI